jgi:hypothetical protein
MKRNASQITTAVVPTFRIALATRAAALVSGKAGRAIHPATTPATILIGRRSRGTRSSSQVAALVRAAIANPRCTTVPTIQPTVTATAITATPVVHADGAMPTRSRSCSMEPGSTRRSTRCRAGRAATRDQP